MKICIGDKSYFTFRGMKSYELPLCSADTRFLMRARLHPKADDGLGDRVILDPVFPFLDRETLFDFLDSREGSYAFRGGVVLREGAPLSKDPFPHAPALGLFTLANYAALTVIARRESAKRCLSEGALVMEGAEVSFFAEVGEGALIHSGARILGRCKIGENVEISGDSVLIDSVVGDWTTVRSSMLVNSSVGNGCSVGPFAYLREESEVGDGCRVGDFVELKRAKLGSGTKAAHLAYVGDAELGKKVNIGCGAVFANYDGKKKSRTLVGNGCFIGSNCNLIAPLKLGDGAFLAAGTTLTQDLNAEDFCVGRCRETVKPKRGKQYYDPK